MQLYINLVIVVTTLLIQHSGSPCSNGLAQDAGQILYKIPDPFGANKERGKSYFSITSYQTVINGHKKTEIEVEEYFSLAHGHTYSIHRDRNNANHEYAIIGDGPRGKSYIVRNPGAERGDQLDCELDHLHHYKQVFPWQYVYEVRLNENKSDFVDDNNSNNQTTTTSDKKKKNRKNRNKSNKRFIYGIGAIWMNAIKRGLVTNQVGDESSYPMSNVWLMIENDLEVRFMFDKPQVEWNKLDIIEQERLIAATPLNAIHMLRKKVLENEEELDGVNAVDETLEIITVREFKRDISKDDISLKRFFEQLAECRRRTRKHRVFPSLMRAVSLSAERLYALEYVERKYNGLQVGGKDHTALYDDRHHRVVRDVELHTEWFSFRHEAQVDVYESADSLTSKDVMDALVDVFLKRYSDRESDRSSRHSTIHYHMQERNGEVERCKRAEADPLPNWFSLMIRKTHFRRKNGNTITGLITGLGALIMNAAEVHYKKFDLFKRTINALYDPSNLNVRRKVKVDEWQLFHRQTGRTVHFYFTDKEDGSAQEIEDLIRVDIRDSKAKNPSEVIESDGDEEENENTYDMLVRYEILSFETDVSHNEAEFMFTPAEECNSDHQDGSVSDDEKDEEENFNQDAGDFFPTYDENDGIEEDENAHPDETQDDGEDFELEPGKFVENFQFPDFYDLLDGRAVYRMSYAIELAGDDSEAAEGAKDTMPSKRIHLMDDVDVVLNLARHAVFFSKKAMDEMRPDLEFYIDYNSEYVFRRESLGGFWSIVEDVDPWFRLLSAKLTYRDHNSVLKNRLRSFGLGALWRSAHLSEHSYFLGISKKTISMDDKCEYKEVFWSLDPDGDSRLQIVFSFLWNSTQFNLDSASGTGRRPDELLSLHSVQLTPQLEDDFGDDDNNGDEGSSNSNSGQSFAPMGADFVAIQIPEPISIEPTDSLLKLPDECIKLVEEHQADKNKESDLDTRIPSFWDFIKATNTYSAVYYVAHVPKAETEHVQALSITRIAEYVDRNRNLGRLVIGSGPETREVYVNDQTKTIYSFMPETNICKRIASLSSLLDLVTGLEAQDVDFSARKMFGLAALWIHLWESSKLTLSKVEQLFHDFDKMVERRTYHLETDFDGRGQGNSKHPVSYSLTASFKSNPRLSATPLSAQIYHPEYIEFRPTYGKSYSGRSPIQRTTIHVGSMLREIPMSVDLDPPAECSKADESVPVNTPDKDPDSSNLPPQPKPGVEFPRLSDLLLGNPFYMRSEVTSETPLTNNSKKLYIIDEHLNGKGDIRLKTYGLQKDFDLLVYGATKESFDVSTPYKCLRVLPKLYQSASARSTKNLLNFWSGEVNFVESLSQLYYGPVSLWRQAELNMGNAKLISSIDLAPLPNGDSDDMFEKVKREMLTEVWRITSPNEMYPWSYEMHFELVVSEESGRKWHVLEKIDIHDTTMDHIEIDVINYRYKHSEQEILEKFNLPEGYNCCRNAPIIEEQQKNSDDLDVDWNSAYQMWYEASLELMDADTRDDPELGPLGDSSHVVLPTATGYIIRSGKHDGRWPPVDVHYKKSHRVDGYTTNIKTVYDRISSLLYVSDERQGFCGIGHDDGGASEVSIEFVGPDSVEYIMLDSRLLNLLFKDTKLFLPINRYTANGFVYSVYERPVDMLNIRGTLQGPATIIRRYAHQVGAKLPHRGGDAGQSAVSLHKSLSVRMLVFDTTRTRVTTILNMKLMGISNIGLSDLISYMNVAECYNDGNEHSDKQMRTFVFEYQGSEFAIKSTASRLTSTVDNFIAILSKSSYIMPTQFAGLPRIDFASNKRLRITVNLIEAPTAIEYATRKMVETRMSLELESKSEMKLVSGLEECSRWCDQVGCVALTYCSDRTCRLVTPNMMHEGDAGRGDDALTPQDLSKLFERVKDSDCNNFIWISKRPSRLDTFASSMDLIINQERNSTQLAPFGLTLFGTYYETPHPVRFYELEDDLNSFNEDSNLNSSDMSLAREPVYKIWGHNQRLEQAKFSKLVEDDILESRKFTLTTKQGHSYTQCLELCRIDQDCVMASYCKKPTATCLLVSGKGNLMALHQALVQEYDEDSGCSVNVRDFLTQYQQFKDTSEPKSFQMSLDNYSPLDCAALCSHYDGSHHELRCLSFDHCTQSMSQSSRVENSTVSSYYTKSTCYLQADHIMLDSFDRSILEPSWHREDSAQYKANTNERKPVCDHYSKSVLADFRRIADRELAIAERQVVKGSSPDQCAIDCQRDEQCQGFEYCFDDGRRPIQSCYFIRAKSDDQLKLDATFEEKLNFSHKCSVYVMEHQEERYELDENVHIKLMDTTVQLLTKGSGFIHFSIVTLLYISVSIFVGSMIQLVYIKFFGHPIIVHRRM